MDKESKKEPTGQAYCPPGMTRKEYVVSPQFIQDLNEAMNDAAKQAVAEHHVAGRSVWAEVDGKWQEIPPPHQKKEK